MLLDSPANANSKVKVGIETAVLAILQKLKSIYRIRIRTGSDQLAVIFCLAAVAFLLCGNLVHLNRIRLHVASLYPLDANEPLISGSGFASNAVYPTTTLPPLQGNLKLYGSWLGSNNPTGSAHSPWYPASAKFYVFVAGYPNHPRNQLLAEIDTAHSGLVRLPVSPYDEPAESCARGKSLWVGFESLSNSGSLP